MKAGISIFKKMQMSKIEKTTKIAVQAHPGAKKNEVLRFEAGVWHLKIAAPPTEGKANKELIEFLSEILDVSKSRLSIEKGTTSHRKLISVQGLTQAIVDEKLKKTLA
jgi:uncharacterized protein